MAESESVVAAVTVLSTETLSPHFTRIELGGAALADVGVAGPFLDQRIKLVLPPPGGEVPDLGAAGDDWYGLWESLPEDVRGAMRTYTVREARGEGADRRIVVDFVLHLEPGATGPAATWAAAATPGDRVILVGPRIGEDWGGIEYDAGDADRIVLAGDETAVPAISGILAGLAPDVVGTAFLEVPTSADVLDVPAPTGVEVRWLPRDGAELGTLLIESVLGHLGTTEHETVADDEVDDDLWETPTYSSSDEDIDERAPAGIPGLYVWIAGESKVVTTLRRHLVNDLGVERGQVAFMGYWRRGVAMRG